MKSRLCSSNFIIWYINYHFQSKSIQNIYQKHIWHLWRTKADASQSLLESRNSGTNPFCYGNHCVLWHGDMERKENGRSGLTWEEHCKTVSQSHDVPPGNVCTSNISVLPTFYSGVASLWWDEAGQAEGTTVQQARGRTVQAACFHSDPGRIKLH